MEGDDTLALFCKASDFDASAGTCSAPFYGPFQGVFPPLSSTDGLLISVAIVGVWAVGWKVRVARRAARS